MRLTLIRHGQTPSNVAGLLDTVAPGPPLTELGRQQAAAIPAALADTPIDAVFTSNLVRTGQTAAPLAAARGLAPVELSGLREIVAGDLEMAGGADAIHRYIGTLWNWLEGDLGVRMPGAASGDEVLARFDAAVGEIGRVVGETGSAVAFSHGAVIRFWAAHRAGNAASTTAGKQHLDNTGAVVLDRVDGGGWQVRSWRSEALGGYSLDDPARSGPAT